MNIHWNVDTYAKDFDFVPQYGEGVLDLIDAPRGAYVLDLGCGTGALTEKLLERGYRAVGIDSSREMIARARQLHPDIPFRLWDALDLQLSEKADVIFSNAVFHWIDAKDQGRAAQNIAASLKDGGALVTEFGGYGCAETVHSALEACFERHGLVYPRTFFFPTIGEYATILEKAGLQVVYATLFDRPTPQKTEDGAADWIRMFVTAPFMGMEDALAEEIIAEAVEDMRPVLYRDGQWIIDYVRIRVKARKLPGR